MKKYFFASQKIAIQVEILFTRKTLFSAAAAIELWDKILHDSRTNRKKGNVCLSVCLLFLEQVLSLMANSEFP